MSRDALEQNQIPIYFVAVIAAAIGGLIAPAAAQSLNALVTPTIAVLMYAMFLQIPFLDLRKSLINPAIKYTKSCCVGDTWMPEIRTDSLGV